MAMIIRQLLEKQSLAVLYATEAIDLPAALPLTNVIIVKIIERKIICPIYRERIVDSFKKNDTEIPS